MSSHLGPLGQQLAAELRAELGRQNKSRRWLADQMQEPHATVSRWVNGQTAPSLDQWDSMCRALGFGVADLLTAVQRRGEGGPMRRATDRRFLVAV